MKTAVITGITGQSGSYLVELLLSKEYRVVGMSRRASTPNDERIRHLYSNKNFIVLHGDITDSFSVLKIILDYQPDEVYNLAAQSQVAISFEQPSYTTDATYKGCLNVLEAIRSAGLAHTTKFYQASSSEMFGSCCSTRDGLIRTEHLHPPAGERSEPFQDEHTRFAPNSPYAIAKLAAHNLVRVYRDSYGMFACCGILHNHESPRRGDQFVTRKITKHLAMLIRLGELRSPKLKLGNLDACRDWGHASDYVLAMWLMLQADQPDDYVVATGVARSVREFLLEAFAVGGIDLTYKLEDYVEFDRALLRPCEVPFLRGSAEKIKERLGWTPTTSFSELVRQMVYADIERLAK